MTAAQAKAHLDPATGEPMLGYVSVADMKAAIDQTYGDMALIEPGTPQELDDLTDVVAPAPAAGQVLAFNGSTWRPSTLPSSGGSGSAQGVFIEDFAGSTDQERLYAAMLYVASQTYRPPILLKAKNYSFSPIHTFDGLRIIGAPGAASNADRAGTPGGVGTRVTCTGSGVWLMPEVDRKPGQSWDVSIENIAFTGNTNLTWLTDASVVLWCWSIKNVTFNAFRSVIGSAATKMQLNACWFTGYWQINNCSQTAIHIGGSDNSLWTEGMLLDSNPENLPGNGSYHMLLGWLAKSTIGGSGMVYVTCEDDWGGILIRGNTTDGPLFLQNVVSEGRNVGEPGTVGCIRQESGWTHFDNVWASFCQANPIQLSGGLLIVNRGAYRPCTASPPAQWVHQTAGTLHITACYQSGITKPVVNHAGGSIAADSTVTVV